MIVKKLENYNIIVFGICGFIIYFIFLKDICIFLVVYYKIKIKINFIKFYDCYGGV